jgi:hypothetical protein
MDRINGANWADIGGGKRGFRKKNKAAGISGTEITETFLNDVQEELCGAISDAGIMPTAGNRTQLSAAIQTFIQRGQPLNGGTAGGTATALTCTLVPAPPAPVAGQQIFVKTSSAATGPATLNISSLGAQSIVWPDGSAISAGDWAAGTMLSLAFNGAAWQLSAGYSTVGKTQNVSENSTKLATTAWVTAAMATLAATAGFSGLFGSNGYIKLPIWFGGLIIQWGTATVSGLASQSFSFPLAFPTSCLQIVGSDIGGSTTSMGITPVTNAAYTVFLPSAGTKTFRFIAVGS